MLAGLSASFLASFDLLIVIAVLPNAARDVGGLHRYALAVGAYGVAQVVAMPIGGALSDRLGAYRTLVAGAAVFAAGTVVAGLATSMDQIAAGRLVQGFGGGFLLSVPLVIWTVHVPDRLHAYAFGANSAVWGISGLLGPPVGALLVATLGWRWVFWINLPALAAMVALAAAGLRGRRGGVGPHGPVNVVGPLLVGATVLALLTVPWAALLPALLFLLVERRSRAPVIPRRVSGIAVCAISFANGVTFLGAEGFLTLDLQAGAGWSTLAASAPLIGTTVAWTTGTVMVARLPWDLRRAIGVGASIVACATLAMAVPVGGGLPVALGYVLSGLGMGIASPAMFAAVLSQAGAEGRETAAVAVSRTVGGGVGVALAGAVVVHLSSAGTLALAQAGASPLPSLHDAARLSFALLAATSFAALPALRAVRRERQVPAAAAA